MIGVIICNLLNNKPADKEGERVNTQYIKGNFVPLEDHDYVYFDILWEDAFLSTDTSIPVSCVVCFPFLSLPFSPPYSLTPSPLTPLLLYSFLTPLLPYSLTPSLFSYSLTPLLFSYSLTP